jgi:hypothetical protein
MKFSRAVLQVHISVTLQDAKNCGAYSGSRKIPSVRPTVDFSSGFTRWRGRPTGSATLRIDVRQQHPVAVRKAGIQRDRERGLPHPAFLVEQSYDGHPYFLKCGLSAKALWKNHVAHFHNGDLTSLSTGRVTWVTLVTQKCRNEDTEK